MRHLKLWLLFINLLAADVVSLEHKSLPRASCVRPDCKCLDCFFPLIYRSVDTYTERSVEPGCALY